MQWTLPSVLASRNFQFGLRTLFLCFFACLIVVGTSSSAHRDRIAFERMVGLGARVIDTELGWDHDSDEAYQGQAGLYVDLRKCRDLSFALRTLGKTDRVVAVNLSHRSDLAALHFRYLAELRGLEWLDLSFTSPPGDAWPMLGALEKLELLDLSGVDLGAKSLADLRKTKGFHAQVIQLPPQNDISLSP